MYLSIFRALWLILAALPMICAAQQPLRVAYSDIELPPYTLGNGDLVLARPGIYLELLNLTAKKLNLQLEYRRMPVKQAQQLLRLGQIDAFFALSFKPERMQFAVFPMQGEQPNRALRLSTISYYLYTLKGKAASPNSANDVVGANLGYSIAAELRERGMRVEETKSTDSNLKKLQLRRIDAFAGQDVDTDPLLSTAQYANIGKSEQPLAEKDYFIVFSTQFAQANAGLCAQFWQVLSQMREQHQPELARQYSGLKAGR